MPFSWCVTNSNYDEQFVIQWFCSVVSVVQGKPNSYNMMRNVLLKAFIRICVTVRWRHKATQKSQKGCKQQNWVFKVNGCAKHVNKINRIEECLIIAHRKIIVTWHIKLWKEEEFFLLNIRWFHSTWSTVISRCSKTSFPEGQTQTLSNYLVELLPGLYL